MSTFIELILSKKTKYEYKHCQCHNEDHQCDSSQCLVAVHVCVGVCVVVHLGA